MNRRSFFNSLSAAVAGCYLATHIKLAEVVKLAAAPSINPEWVSAPYEIAFLFDPKVYSGEMKWVHIKP